MNREKLVVVLAAVFAGLTTLLVVAALARQPFLLLVAVPFAVTTYLLWYHASGRLADRTRRRAARSERAPGRSTDPEARAGFEWREERAHDRTAGQSERTRGNSTRAGGARGDRTRANRRRATAGAAPPQQSRLSREEALRVLGLSADERADEAAIKRAYREKVKEVHPDTASGDEAAFKRVTRAYERLTE